MTKNSIFTLSKALCVFFSLIFGVLMLGTQLADKNKPFVSGLLNQPMQKIEVAEGFVVPNDPATGVPYTNYPIQGVKDENYPWYFKPNFKSLKEIKEGAGEKRGTSAVADQIEAEGATLLYNKNNALPLAQGSKVSLFSVGTLRAYFGPQGAHGVSGSGPYVYTTLHTNLEAYKKAGFLVNETLWANYLAKHGNPSVQTNDTGNNATTPFRRNRTNTPAQQKFGDIPWATIYTDNSQEVKDSVASFNDAAIFTWTRSNGENVELMAGAYGTGTEPYSHGNSGVDAAKLSDKERSVLVGLTALKKAGTIKKIIFNVNSNNMIAMEFMNDPAIDVDAVIWTGGHGEMGIYTVPKLLTGEYNFSGSLSMTAFYNNYDIPAVANNQSGAGSGTAHDGTNIHYTNALDISATKSQKTTAYVVYKEGVYVGYRYPETRYEDVVLGRAKTGSFKYKDTIFSTFGSGLSYTSFSFSNFSVTPKVAWSGDTYTASVRVTNNGAKAGKKSVQIYAQKPYTQYSIDNQVEKPSVELVGFGKTKLLQPGTSEIVTVEIDGKYLASYDYTKAKTYIIDAGAHYLAVGNNAHDALNNILARKGKTTANGMDYNGVANLSWSTNLAFDAEKYSKSDQTGNPITNLFDQANWNTYTNKGPEIVKYVSRNDWEGTLSFFEFVPGGAVGTRNYYSDSYAKGYEVLSVKSQILKDQRENFEPEPDDGGAVAYPTYGADNGLSLIDLMMDTEGNWISYDDPLWDKLLDQMTWDEMCLLVQEGFRHTVPVGSINKPQSFEFNESNGIALGSWNSSSPDGQVAGKALARAFDDPDKDKMAELWPNNPIMTATLNVELMYECGLLWGEEGMWAGFSGLYGVGFNTLRTPYGSRHAEYFSEDPYAGGTIGSYLVAGMQSRGMNCVIKHFVLNESEIHRVGASMWINEQALREIYLRMFEIPIAMKYVNLPGYAEPVLVGGAMNVMGSKGRIGPYMCVAYEPLQTGWLRKEAGLRGFSTTDTLESAINSKPAQVKAGTTLSDDNGTRDDSGTNGNIKTFEPYKTGHGDFAWKLREAAKRNCYHVVHSNAMNGFAPGTKIIPLTPPWIGWLATINTIVGILFGLSCIFLATVIVMRRIKV